MTALVLEELPSGEFAWLESTEPGEDDDALYTVTESGREYLARQRAMQALFGPQLSVGALRRGYVPCSGCGLRYYGATEPSWNCPDFPQCAEVQP